MKSKTLSLAFQYLSKKILICFSASSHTSSLTKWWQGKFWDTNVFCDLHAPASLFSDLMVRPFSIILTQEFLQSKEQRPKSNLQNSKPSEKIKPGVPVGRGERESSVRSIREEKERFRSHWELSLGSKNNQDPPPFRSVPWEAAKPGGGEGRRRQWVTWRGRTVSLWVLAPWKSPVEQAVRNGRTMLVGAPRLSGGPMIRAISLTLRHLIKPRDLHLHITERAGRKYQMEETEF